MLGQQNRVHLDGVAQRHDHGERVPPLPGEGLLAEGGAVLAVLPKDHHVLGEGAGLVAEEMCHKAELLVDVRSVTPGAQRQIQLGTFWLKFWLEDCLIFRFLF